MVTRLVHIGDLHLGPGARNADRLRALDQILEENLADPQLGAWLLPGDLNHARMTIDDRNALAAVIQRAAQAAPVIVAYGNHDLPGDLDVFARIAARHHIFVIAEPQTITVPLANIDGVAAAIFVLPYPQKAGLVAAGVAKGDVPTVAADPLEAIFRYHGALLAEARAKGDIALMIGHVNVAGAVMSAGQPNIGQEIELSPRHLDLLGDCPKLLNHIHRGQTIGGAVYAGSVCRLDWGEVEPKRYLVVDVDEHGAYDIIEKPIDVAPMYHVEGELTKDGFTWHVVGGEPPASWAGCEVRVRYRFAKSEATILDKAAAVAPFAEAYRLQAEPIAMPDTALRAPAVAEARTLADKVRAWCAMNHVEASDTLIAKLAALEHGDADALIRDLVARLSNGVEKGVAA